MSPFTSSGTRAATAVLLWFLISCTCKNATVAAENCCCAGGAIWKSLCSEGACSCSSGGCTGAKVEIFPLGVSLDSTKMDILLVTVMALTILVPIYLIVGYFGGICKLRFANLYSSFVYNFFFLIMWCGQVVLIYLLYGSKDSWDKASLSNIVGVTIMFLTALALLQCISPQIRHAWFLLRYGYKIGFWNAFWGPDSYKVYFGTSYAGRLQGLPHMRHSLLLNVGDSVSIVGCNGKIPCLGRVGKVSITRYNKYGLQTYVRETQLSTKDGQLILFLQSESKLTKGQYEILD